MMCTTCDERPAVARKRRCWRCANAGNPPSPLPPPDRIYTADTSWRAHAACAGTDPDLFYPVRPGGRGGGPARQAHEHAISICHRCPVAYQCLWYALDHGEEYGVWGATTPQDRRALQRIRRRRKATA